MAHSTHRGVVLTGYRFVIKGDSRGSAGWERCLKQTWGQGSELLHPPRAPLSSLLHVPPSPEAQKRPPISGPSGFKGSPITQASQMESWATGDRFELQPLSPPGGLAVGTEVPVLLPHSLSHGHQPPSLVAESKSHLVSIQRTPSPSISEHSKSFRGSEQEPGLRRNIFSL